MSDRGPDLDLGGHFALGPSRVRRAGYGAMQLASDEGSGATPGSRSGAILPAAQVLPDPGLVVPIVPSMSVQLAVRARHQDDADILVHLLIGRGRRGISRWRSTLDLKGSPE